MTQPYRQGKILVPRAQTMSEEAQAEIDSGYIIVRSASTVLASASNKLSAWVSMKMESGWSPHGPPQIFYDGEKFYLIQAMTQ